ncbi:MAG: metallophosphoesterase [Bacteroides sp.]
MTKPTHTNPRGQWTALTLFLLLVCSSFTPTYGQEPKLTYKKYVDGPYLFFEENNQIRSITHTPEGGVVDERLQLWQGDTFCFPVYSPDGEYLFEVPLRPDISRPEAQLKQAKRVFITSDPHGDWESFADLLQRNGIVDEHYRWAYGDNQLVVIGDIFDRGVGVLPIFWLMYKLEQEAQEAGGAALFMLGNHEPMVLGGDLRYVKQPYLIEAKEVGMPYDELFGPTSVLGDWLYTRNTMQLIGDKLFVHAGISKELIAKGYTLDQVNAGISEGLFYHKSYRKKQSENLKFLYGNKGPIWYRGMVRHQEKYHPIDAGGVDEVLAYFGASRIFVGHTIFEEVASFFGGQVIAVNVKNAKNREAKRSRAVLLEGDQVYVVKDTGLEPMELDEAQ